MTDSRFRGAKKNIFVSIGCQLITLLCGIIVPGLMINAYGSEAYGATVSITQFLSYIALLEGGVGGVARAALYPPLAAGDMDAISGVMAEMKRFFRIIACVFGVYVLVIACTFNQISHSSIFDGASTFLLVLSISLSTFGQYFIGVSNMVLLQAAQKSYVTNLVNIVGMVVNTLMILLLVALGCDIITVKLVSSLVFIMRPIALLAYVRCHYPLHPVPRSSKVYLTQKWSGVSQHIAFFLHSNTDVVILTCFASLRAVAVYSVYNMVVANMQNLAASFIAGMEALFGDMLAKNEHEKLNRTFQTYETIISIVAVLLFAVTTVMIVPFVRIYTAGVTDVEYEMPLFALLLTLSALLYCLRMPYHAAIIAAGHFRQTQLAAYGEAILNVGLSLLLVGRFGLVGVAAGTLTASGFRLVCYVIYLSRHILRRRVALFLQRSAVNAVIYAADVLAGMLTARAFSMTGYGSWALCGAATTLIAAAITAAGNLLYDRQSLRTLISRGKTTP